MQQGFVYLDEFLPGVLWDAKYATDDNFTGAIVDGYRANRVVGTLDMARVLKKVQEDANARGFELLLWDAYRPKRAVARFLAWAVAPEDGRTRARHYPNIAKTDIVPLGYVAARSGHSRGSAIDLTLCDLHTHIPLDMGGDFDLMDERSHHDAPGLSELVAGNRRLLKALMEENGFSAYQGEWWHYNLKNEPYPDTYFDFPIDIPEKY